MGCPREEDSVGTICGYVNGCGTVIVRRTPETYQVIENANVHSGQPFAFLESLHFKSTLFPDAREMLLIAVKVIVSKVEGIEYCRTCVNSKSTCNPTGYVANVSSTTAAVRCT